MLRGGKWLTDHGQAKAAIGLADQAATRPDITQIGGLFSNAFNMYIGMERSARTLVTYQEQVPGLLQTADYARATFAAFPGFKEPEDIDRRVDIRLGRQAILTRKLSPLKAEVLLHESALHRVVGGPSVMAVQLRHLADFGTRPNITLRVHPYSAGMTWGFLHGHFAILEFAPADKEPPVVYVEGRLASDLYVERPEEVRRYHEVAADIRRTALDETTTRDLLRRAAREFENAR